MLNLQKGVSQNSFHSISRGPRISVISFPAIPDVPGSSPVVRKSEEHLDDVGDLSEDMKRASEVLNRQRLQLSIFKEG